MKTIRKSALNSLVVVLLVVFPSQVLASELLERIRAQATQTSGEIRAEVQRIADSAAAKGAAEVRFKVPDEFAGTRVMPGKGVIISGPDGQRNVDSQEDGSHTADPPDLSAFAEVGSGGLTEEVHAYR